MRDNHEQCSNIKHELFNRNKQWLRCWQTRTTINTMFCCIICWMPMICVTITSTWALIIITKHREIERERKMPSRSLEQAFRLSLQQEVHQVDFNGERSSNYDITFTRIYLMTDENRLDLKCYVISCGMAWETNQHQPLDLSPLPVPKPPVSISLFLFLFPFLTFCASPFHWLCCYFSFVSFWH